MQITNIRYISASPYISRQQVSENFGICLSSVDNRIRELITEIKKGRYSELAVIKDGGFVFVNYLALIDYLANRQKLRNKNLRKYVESYDPTKVAKEIGWYTEVES